MGQVTATQATRWIFGFDEALAGSAATKRSILGNKGSNLAAMTALGLPVPSGFTIVTDLCRFYLKENRTYPLDFASQLDKALVRLENQTGRKLGSPEKPLFLAIRPGAHVSMPGIMDSILNLGMNDETVEGLAAESGDARYAYDSYRRFIQTYSDIVLGIDSHDLEDIVEDHKDGRGLLLDTDLNAEDWQTIIHQFFALIEDELGEPFPQDARDQLWGALDVVLSSWQSARAATYRALHDISEEGAMGVNIQMMIFGNMGETSGCGRGSTRNPSTGRKELVGEFLLNAQGDELIEGADRKPIALAVGAEGNNGQNGEPFERLMPQHFAQFQSICELLEAHYRDMQQVEFSIQQGKLWMLQTRLGKRSILAGLRIAVDMAQEGLINQEEAVMRIDPRTLDQLLHPTIDDKVERNLFAKGLAASPGAAAGHLVFTSEDAEALSLQGKKVILVRIETSPEDIHGMHVAEGILTARGGMTSHAAVVARGMGIPCVSGAGMLRINYAKKTMKVGETILQQGELLTIDGSSGDVLLGEVPMQKPELPKEFSTLMSWVDGIRRMKVRCNAESRQDVMAAHDFGAEGIGLCRTEHMFFDESRIGTMREMIIADSQEARRAALAKLLPMQRDDFTELFEIMAGTPITIRLLDPPLHEFLPHDVRGIDTVAQSLNVEVKALYNRVNLLHEFNPMLGHRGCRLAITYPEIAEMQARAIFEAAVEAGKRTGRPVKPEIMVPLVSLKEELDFVKALIDATAEAVMEETNQSFDYIVGTMIELPRAALQARKIAEAAEFFSFGTNDLTQTTYGISRDDASRFINDYVRSGVIEQDPFISIDIDGVGELVEIAVERGRFTRPDIELGICGEHGGDPASIEFCEMVGLDYVSCSPFRVPIARLAAAQATLKRHNQQ